MSNRQGNGRNGQGKPPENDQGMDLNQVIQMGEQESQLLNSQIYNVAHRMAIDETIQAWAATSPKEREKRESLWAEVQAHGRAAMVLSGMVERAQQAMVKQSEQREVTENEFLDKQGFGDIDRFSGPADSYQ